MALPNNQLHLDVSGTAFSIPKPLASKFPYSKLADLVYEDAPRGGRHRLALDAQAFAVIVHFLHTDAVVLPPGVSMAQVERVSEDLAIPLPYIPPQPAPPAQSQPEAASVPPKSAFNTNPFANLPDDPTPSYEESMQGSVIPAPYPPEKPAPPSHYSTPLLPTQLASVREQRIHALITNYIQPHLDAQGLSGLHATTCILVPSNVHALQPSTDLSPPTVLGFPSSTSVSLTYLPGPEHVLEFWRQPVVLAELQQTLRARFSAPGAPGVPDTPDTTRKRGDLLRRGLWNGGWRAANEGSPLGVGEVRVGVEVRAVSVRVVSEMGLFETRSGEALVLSVEVGV